jgi:hypothetical protein
MLINNDFCKESLVSPVTRVLYLGGMLDVPDKQELARISDLTVAPDSITLLRDRFPKVYELPVFLEQEGGNLQFGRLSVLMRGTIPDSREAKFTYMPLVHLFLAGLNVEDCARYVAGVDADELVSVTVLYAGVETSFSDAYDLEGIRSLCEVVKKVSVLKISGALARYKL